MVAESWWVVVTYTLTDECNNSTSTTGAFTIEDTDRFLGFSHASRRDGRSVDAVPDAFVATASDGCDTDVDVVYGNPDGRCL